MTIVELKPRVIIATYWTLMHFTHKELKAYAKVLGVPQGKIKRDTAVNLSRSGKATICATLGT